MNENEIRALGYDCYGAFNMNPPAVSSSAWRLWAEICADVPFEASAWIRSKIIELDSLPRNFGKAVRNYASEWRTETGQPRIERHCCPDCDRQVPGFFFAWRKDESGLVRSAMLRCLCNNDLALDPMPRKSKAQAEREGCAVMPRGYTGSPASFERKTFGQPVSATSPDFAGLAKKLARNPVGPEKMREAHVRQLAEYADTMP